jgi:hypothetical protein
MSVDEAVATSKHVVKRLRDGDIEVIRVGLQPAVDLQEAPDVIAGPYDPAMRQRVESELLRGAAADALRRAFSVGVEEFTFLVHPREEAFLRGHENEVLRRLRDQFRLRSLRVVASPRASRGRPIAVRGSPGSEAIDHASDARKAS